MERRGVDVTVPPSGWREQKKEGTQMSAKGANERE
jgi:hypothetical protein